MAKRTISLARISGILKELPAIEKIVVIPYTEERADISGLNNAVHYQDFLSKEEGLTLEFAQLPFDHPLYIMYSSGTHWPSQVHGSRSRRDLGTAPQRASLALRPQERRQDLLLHHMRMDDVELVGERSCSWCNGASL